MDAVLENVQAPTFLTPASFAVESMPEGTPFGFVRASGVGTPAPVRFDGTDLVIAGEFSRLGTQCTSDEDCACDPETDGPLCTSAEMECGGIWCRSPEGA